MRSFFCSVLVLSALLFGAPMSFAGQKCQGVVPYRGDALHEPLQNELWQRLDALPELNGEFDLALAAKLDEGAAWILKNTKSPAVSAAIGIPGRGIWSTSRGLQTLQPPTPLAKQPYFYWASAGKAFTSVVIMQLIEEKKLTLDTSLATYFPDFPNAQFVTIEHLLTHTSGVQSFIHDAKWHQTKAYRSPTQTIEGAAKRGSEFCPGERWFYSNTGYILLGQIIEKLEKRPYHEVVQTRIIEQLKLRNTVALAPKQKLLGLTDFHIKGKVDKEFDVTIPYSAGGIAASAQDMVVFWHAFLGGKLVSKTTRQNMFARLYPMFDKGTFYGQGVMVYEFGDQDKKNIWLGHSGGIPSAKAVVAYDTSTNIFVAAALNADVSAEATANKLLSVVKQHTATQ